MATDIDIDRQTCAQELVDRFDTSLQYTRQWSETVLGRFGGQPFTGDDWGHLIS